MAIVLVVVGVVVVVLALLVGLANMLRGFRGFMSGSMSFGSFIETHLAVIGVSALGSLLVFVGFVMLVVEFLSRH